MRTYFLACFVALGISAQAQQLGTIKLNCAQPATVTQLPPPLLLVNGQESTPNALVLAPDHIASVKVIKGAEATERFGKKGANGTILLELKKELPLARIQEVYSAFQVPQKQQKLTVAIDGKHVPQPELLLADLRQIERVEIADFEMNMSRWSFEEQYLNIITKPQD